MTAAGGINGRFIMWLLGIVGAILLFAGTLVSNTIVSLGTRLSLLERQQASMEQKLSQIDELINLTRKEQIDRTMRFADFGSKIVSIETEQRWIKDRIDSIVARLVAVHGRLESLGATPSKAGDDPFSPRRLTPAPPRED